MSFNPEAARTYEISMNEAFLRSLDYCGGLSNSLESEQFSQCIKAAGINHSYTYKEKMRYSRNLHMFYERGILDK